MGGGGICLPFHCDCGLKCCAQDCQMMHFMGMYGKECVVGYFSFIQYSNLNVEFYTLMKA